MQDLKVQISVLQPPALAPGAAFGLQDQAQHLQEGTATAEGSLNFTCSLTVVHRPRLDAPDYKGPYVQGKAGERFLYLSHGTLNADGRWTWIQRWKLMLASLPPELIESAGEAGLQATIRQLAGTRPLIEWDHHPDIARDHE